MTFKHLEQLMQQKIPYVIYGAGVVANEIYVAVKELYNIKPYCFLVTKKDGHYQTPKEMQVYCIEDCEEDISDYLVLVATPEVYHDQIKKHLFENKVINLCCIDSHIEYCLMSRYYRKIKRFPLLEDIKSTNNFFCQDIEKFFSVYMVRSEKDVKLKRDYKLPPWIIPVWAGSKCSENDKTVFGQIKNILMDSEGENISFKNKNYCELTVAYWAWKNRSNTYMGICHYRRVLLLKKQDLEACISENIDVILPLPFICHPNATGQYLRYIDRKDREALERSLYEISPEYIETLHRVDREPYFYNYNMFIAKKNVFYDYCEWLFAILERAEKYCEPKFGIRNDRYAGYLGELLATLYFIKNKNKLKIVHGEKKWLI